MRRYTGTVSNNVVVLEQGVRLPDGARVEVRLLTPRELKAAAIERVLANRITRPVGMEEIIENEKREREDR